MIPANHYLVNVLSVSNYTKKVARIISLLRAGSTCVDFELSKMGEEQLKCLLFVCGRKDESDKDMRTRMLARIEDKPDVTLQQL